MAEVIEIDHARRARRLLRILVDRVGVAHYLIGGRERCFRLDQQRVDDAVDLASEWIGRRSGSAPTGGALVFMHREVRRLLIRRVAEGLLRAGY